MPTRIFHITHIDNLPLILESGGLIAKSQLLKSSARHLDISYESVQGWRSRKAVPCGAGGVVHDYVPFYFAPRSPMLYTIHKGNVANYQGGQRPILHLVTTIEEIHAQELSFVFTDGHAIMDYSDFYDDLELLDEVIDWQVMKSQYWYDTDEDPNRKCKRQAEFLVHQFFPWHLITEIGAIDPAIQSQVNVILQNSQCETPVRVYRNWYY
ncbi:DUF4433 domain-containing protein [Leptolyngbya sp. DQ-M1]|uniref:type II toxin-antitoxin system toxin DNA ADP-ribosyl transferase DarT n=1 Tax=Leptolyngbya sp. DQ-M1 TaxID=2933920 RepID=UPI00329A0D13